MSKQELNEFEILDLTFNRLVEWYQTYFQYSEIKGPLFISFPIKTTSMIPASSKLNFNEAKNYAVRDTQLFSEKLASEILNIKESEPIEIGSGSTKGKAATVMKERYTNVINTAKKLEKALSAIPPIERMKLSISTEDGRFFCDPLSYVEFIGIGSQVNVDNINGVMNKNVGIKADKQTKYNRQLFRYIEHLKSYNKLIGPSAINQVSVSSLMRVLYGDLTKDWKPSSSLENDQFSKLLAGYDFSQHDL